MASAYDKSIRINAEYKNSQMKGKVNPKGGSLGGIDNDWYNKDGLFYSNSDEVQTMYVSNCYVGRIIGKFGRKIREIQSRSGAIVIIDGDTRTIDNNVEIKLIGSRNSTSHAKQIIEGLIMKWRPQVENQILSKQPKICDDPPKNLEEQTMYNKFCFLNNTGDSSFTFSQSFSQDLDKASEILFQSANTSEKMQNHDDKLDCNPICSGDHKSRIEEDQKSNSKSEPACLELNRDNSTFLSSSYEIKNTKKTVTENLNITWQNSTKIMDSHHSDGCNFNKSLEDTLNNYSVLNELVEHEKWDAGWIYGSKDCKVKPADTVEKLENENETVAVKYFNSLTNTYSSQFRRYQSTEFSDHTRQNNSFKCVEVVEEEKWDSTWIHETKNWNNKIAKIENKNKKQKIESLANVPPLDNDKSGCNCNSSDKEEYRNEDLKSNKNHSINTQYFSFSFTESFSQDLEADESISNVNKNEDDSLSVNTSDTLNESEQWMNETEEIQNESKTRLENFFQGSTDANSSVEENQSSKLLDENKPINDCNPNRNEDEHNNTAYFSFTYSESIDASKVESDEDEYEGSYSNTDSCNSNESQYNKFLGETAFELFKCTGVIDKEELVDTCNNEVKSAECIQNSKSEQREESSDVPPPASETGSETEIILQTSNVHKENHETEEIENKIGFIDEDYLEFSSQNSCESGHSSSSRCNTLIAENKMQNLCTQEEDADYIEFDDAETNCNPKQSDENATAETISSSIINYICKKLEGDPRIVLQNGSKDNYETENWYYSWSQLGSSDNESQSQSANSDEENETKNSYFSISQSTKQLDDNKQEELNEEKEESKISYCKLNNEENEYGNQNLQSKSAEFLRISKNNWNSKSEKVQNQDRPNKIQEKYSSQNRSEDLKEIIPDSIELDYNKTTHKSSNVTALKWSDLMVMEENKIQIEKMVRDYFKKCIDANLKREELANCNAKMQQTQFGLTESSSKNSDINEYFSPTPRENFTMHTAKIENCSTEIVETNQRTKIHQCDSNNENEETEKNKSVQIETTQDRTTGSESVLNENSPKNEVQCDSNTVIEKNLSGDEVIEYYWDTLSYDSKDWNNLSEETENKNNSIENVKTEMNFSSPKFNSSGLAMNFTSFLRNLNGTCSEKMLPENTSTNSRNEEKRIANQEDELMDESCYDNWSNSTENWNDLSEETDNNNILIENVEVEEKDFSSNKSISPKATAVFRSYYLMNSDKMNFGVMLPENTTTDAVQSNYEQENDFIEKHGYSKWSTVTEDLNNEETENKDISIENLITEEEHFDLNKSNFSELTTDPINPNEVHSEKLQCDSNQENLNVDQEVEIMHDYSDISSNEPEDWKNQETKVIPNFIENVKTEMNSSSNKSISPKSTAVFRSFLMNSDKIHFGEMLPENTTEGTVQQENDLIENDTEDLNNEETENISITAQDEHFNLNKSNSCELTTDIINPNEMQSEEILNENKSINEVQCEEKLNVDQEVLFMHDYSDFTDSDISSNQPAVWRNQETEVVRNFIEKVTTEMNFSSTKSISSESDTDFIPFEIQLDETQPEKILPENPVANEFQFNCDKINEKLIAEQEYELMNESCHDKSSNSTEDCNNCNEGTHNEKISIRTVTNQETISHESTTDFTFYLINLTNALRGKTLPENTTTVTIQCNWVGKTITDQDYMLKCENCNKWKNDTEDLNNESISTPEEHFSLNKSISPESTAEMQAGKTLTKNTRTVTIQCSLDEEISDEKLITDQDFVLICENCFDKWINNTETNNTNISIENVATPEEHLSLNESTTDLTPNKMQSEEILPENTTVNTIESMLDEKINDENLITDQKCFLICKNCCANISFKDTEDAESKNNSIESNSNESDLVIICENCYDDWINDTEDCNNENEETNNKNITLKELLSLHKSIFTENSNKMLCDKIMAKIAASSTIQSDRIKKFKELIFYKKNEDTDDYSSSDTEDWHSVSVTDSDTKETENNSIENVATQEEHFDSVKSISSIQSNDEVIEEKLSVDQEDISSNDSENFNNLNEKTEIENNSIGNVNTPEEHFGLNKSISPESTTDFTSNLINSYKILPDTKLNVDQEDEFKHGYCCDISSNDSENFKTEIKNNSIGNVNTPEEYFSLNKSISPEPTTDFTSNLINSYKILPETTSANEEIEKTLSFEQECERLINYFGGKSNVDIVPIYLNISSEESENTINSLEYVSSEEEDFNSTKSNSFQSNTDFANEKDCEEILNTNTAANVVQCDSNEVTEDKLSVNFIGTSSNDTENLNNLSEETETKNISIGNVNPPVEHFSISLESTTDFTSNLINPNQMHFGRMLPKAISIEEELSFDQQYALMNKYYYDAPNSDIEDWSISSEESENVTTEEEISFQITNEKILSKNTTNEVTDEKLGDELKHDYDKSNSEIGDCNNPTEETENQNTSIANVTTSEKSCISPELTTDYTSYLINLNEMNSGNILPEPISATKVQCDWNEEDHSSEDTENTNIFLENVITDEECCCINNSISPELNTDFTSNLDLDEILLKASVNEEIEENLSFERAYEIMNKYCSDKSSSDTEDYNNLSEESENENVTTQVEYFNSPKSILSKSTCDFTNEMHCEEILNTSTTTTEVHCDLDEVTEEKLKVDTENNSIENVAAQEEYFSLNKSMSPELNTDFTSNLNSNEILLQTSANEKIEENLSFDRAYELMNKYFSDKSSSDTEDYNPPSEESEIENVTTQEEHFNSPKSLSSESTTDFTNKMHCEEILNQSTPTTEVHYDSDEVTEEKLNVDTENNSIENVAIQEEYFSLNKSMSPELNTDITSNLNSNKILLETSANEKIEENLSFDRAYELMNTYFSDKSSSDTEDYNTPTEESEIENVTTQEEHFNSPKSIPSESTTDFTNKMHCEEILNKSTPTTEVHCDSDEVTEEKLNFDTENNSIENVVTQEEFLSSLELTTNFTSCSINSNEVHSEKIPVQSYSNDEIAKKVIVELQDYFCNKWSKNTEHCWNIQTAETDKESHFSPDKSIQSMFSGNLLYQNFSTNTGQCNCNELTVNKTSFLQEYKILCDNCFEMKGKITEERSKEIVKTENKETQEAQFVQLENSTEKIFCTDEMEDSNQRIVNTENNCVEEESQSFNNPLQPDLDIVENFQDEQVDEHRLPNASYYNLSNLMEKYDKIINNVVSSKPDTEEMDAEKDNDDIACGSGQMEYNLGGQSDCNVMNVTEDIISDNKKGNAEVNSKNQKSNFVPHHTRGSKRRKKKSTKKYNRR